MSQTTPQFVQEKRVTVSESSFDSTSLQGITIQSEGIKPLRICEEELSTAVIKGFENDEVDHTNGGKVDICGSGHDSAQLSLADHDEMRGMPTTNTELNKISVQIEGEVDLRADAVVEGMDTRETIGVNDQRVAHLSSNANTKLELIVKDSSGGNLAVRQTSKNRKTTASDPPLSSSTCVTQSSSVLSSTMKGMPMNSSVSCFDYASISHFESTKLHEVGTREN
ncbi:unnamed protein product [Trichobilharzia regenti]|nr:unnamed protein product [Trichobilharzia regenti]